MASVDTINLQSLNMVRNELVATIESAAGDLEKFFSSDHEDGSSLQSCIEGVRQIVGTLKLIQFPEASLLAEELLAIANEISPGNSGRRFESRMEVVSNTFFILTRYLEYVQQADKRTPVLLIPHINALRKLRREQAYPESHFFTLEKNGLPGLPDTNVVDIADKKEFRFYVRRARCMYQIGLLGLLKENQLNNSVAMMRRGLIKLWRAAGSSKPLSALWWTANVALEAFSEMDMTPLETRKFLFMRIDRVIKQVELAGAVAFDSAPPKALMKELVYLVTLSGCQLKDSKGLLIAYGSPKLGFTEEELSKEHNALYGPSSHTVKSLAKVLENELISIKRILENASQSSLRKIDDLNGFVDALRKIADILAVVGLTAPGTTIRDQLETVKLWDASDDGIADTEMHELANTLLFVESTIQSLDSKKLTTESLERANSLAQKQSIASTELAVAKKIVIEESEAGIALAKRALSSFSESSYDVGHIANIAKTLFTVRGAMSMLKNARAEMVLTQSIAFVKEVLLDQSPPATLQELLETFADVIVALEYYLNSADFHCEMDDSVLQVGEDGLEALGYAVGS